MTGERQPEPLWQPGACRVCHCDDQDACIDLAGEPCHWVGPHLCSACLPLLVKLGEASRWPRVAEDRAR